MTRTTADYAEVYVRRYGLQLVPLPPRSKRPVADDWGRNVLQDPAAARAYYEANPTANVGLALGPSRMCSLDVDDLEATETICDEFGWSLDSLRAEHPTIQGRAPGMRIMFRVPDDMALPYHALTWPRRDGPGRSTVFELRAANDNQQRQDVLPPSIPPDTGEPYIWLTRPADTAGFQPPPAWLLALWGNWDALKPQLQACCPWSRTDPPAAVTGPRQHRGDSVIDAYDQAHGIEATLERYGYKRQGRRYLSPHSGTKLAGVVVFSETNRAWIHHASDPLCSDESGQPVAPFDLFAHYEHGGDAKRAAKSAAEELGMKRAPKPPATRQAERIDPETGEILPANDNAPAAGLYDLLPDCNDKGRPLSTIENLAEITRRLGVTLRYNVISKEEEILIPGESFSIDNRANASLSWLTSWCARLRMPTDKIGDFVTYLADKNLHNPVAQWIESTPWDGQSRLADLYDTIDAVDNKLKAVLIRRWLISAVAAAFQPDGVSAAGVLTLQGDQYLGKTKWFKGLVPEHLGVLKDGMLLRPDDKDSVKQVCSFWLVELGELDATFRKSDIAALKSFITNKSDVLRRAYARRESQYARRTVFFASVNPKQFLHDTTGNRRYWTIEAQHIDHSHGINMQQLWAEVLTIYRRGESWYLTPDEMLRLNTANEEFQVVDPIVERIESRLRWDTPDTLWRYRSATDILIECGVDRPSQSDATRAAGVIRSLNGNRAKRTGTARLLLAPDRTGVA